LLEWLVKKRGRLDAVNNSGKETAAIIRKEREEKKSN